MSPDDPAEGAHRLLPAPGQRVVILGGGATGVSAFVQLIRFVRANRFARVDAVTLIDVNDPGFGPAFGGAHVNALCNTPSGDTSLLPDKPDDFCEYLRGRGWPHDRDAFVPRFQVAQYARSRFLEHVRLAAALGITTRHVRDRARRVGIGPDGGYVVELASGAVEPASEVLVCTGLGAPVVPQLMAPHLGRPAFFPSPYPAGELLAALPPRGDVLVLGTRLSAVETALLLTDSGHRTVMSSPSGQLPAVRTRLARTPCSATLAAQFRQLPWDAPDRVTDRQIARILIRAARQVSPLPMRRQLIDDTDPHRRLRIETALAEAGANPWQELIAGVIDGLNDWMPLVDPEYAARFMARHRLLISRYVSAIPLVSARRLLTAVDDGRLRVRDYPTSIIAVSGGWLVRRGATTRRFAAVVAATGHHRLGMYVDGHALHLGGTDDAGSLRPTADLRVVIRPPRVERIWLLGPSTHARNPITNYLNAAARQAETVPVSFLDQVGVSV
jgi:hypothetical protein